jgi:PH (Pleckstrin Homology) domain-containing protein
MANDTQPTDQAPTADAPAGTTANDSHVAAALGHLKSILVPGETLAAYAVQRRIFALTKRRVLVAATTGRFIAMSRGLLGGFTPIDMRWQDIEDAHLRVGILGADIAVRAMQREDLASAVHAGGALGATGLRKEQAEQVYRVCQAQSQAWREKRRVRDLDELRAKSGGLQFGTPTSGPAGSAGDAGDPVARLQRAKEMLSGGLITDAEFESIKAKIVDRL